MGSLRSRFALAAVACFVLGGLLAWWSGPSASGPPTARPEPGEGPHHGTAPGTARVVSPPPVSHGSPDRSSPAAPRAPATGPETEVDRALRDHATRSAPRWARAADILVHSPHPELQELATGMALRLERAGAGLDAPQRQELINEERQLLHFLRQRYAGYRPLEAPLERIDQSLSELEAASPAAGESPDPRDQAQASGG